MRGMPFEICHYFRPAIVCMWNSCGKIGTNTYSMFLSHVKMKSARLSPGAAILVQGVNTMAMNVCLVDRAIQGESMLRSGEISSYYQWRKKTTAMAGSFRTFISTLCSQYKLRKDALRNENTEEASLQLASLFRKVVEDKISASPLRTPTLMKRRVRTVYAMKNSSENKIRLSKVPIHKPVAQRRNGKYVRNNCVLCTANVTKKNNVSGKLSLVHDADQTSQTSALDVLMLSSFVTKLGTALETGKAVSTNGGTGKR